jgi:glycosyltransferase involved in cell wall biosynthesis
VSRMRILRLYPFVPPMPGGMEKHVLRLSEEQRALGHEVSIVFNSGAHSADGDLQVLPAVHLRAIRPQFVRDLLFYLAAAVTLKSRRIRADIVHVHGDWSAFCLGKLVAKIVGASRRTASCHCSLSRGWRRRLYRSALMDYDAIYATGYGEAAELTEILGRPVQYQSSGIDTYFCEVSRQPKADIDVITVAVLRREKNLDLMIDIAAALRHMNFTIVGDGPERKGLEAMCKARAVSNVTFVGAQPREIVANLLARSRMFLSTSRREGTPTAMLEAMAVGLPVVTSPANNFSELLGAGEGGVCVETFSAPDYVRVIARLAEDGALMRCMGARNRRCARECTWPAVARRITDWTVA